MFSTCTCTPHLFKVDVLRLCVDERCVRAQVRGHEVDLEVGPGLVVEARLAEEHRLEAGGRGERARAVPQVVAPVVRRGHVARVVVGERAVRHQEGRLARAHVALHAVAHRQVRPHGNAQVLQGLDRMFTSEEFFLNEGPCNDLI